jgi:hypothetical protein
MRRPLILFFNPFFTKFPDTSALDCRAGCDFTHDRSRAAEANALVIHLPACPQIWEARKYPGQLWVAWCLESDVTMPLLREANVMRHFDLTMTYRRDSDVWWPYIPPVGFPPRPAEQLLAPRSAKTERAPAVLFQSARYDRSGRYAFAFDLMKYLRVDSYGKILNNRRLEEPDRGWETKSRLVSRYKFCLALENSRTKDYVTEKFFDPLMAGTVPVYRGAPNIEDFAPGEKCFINADDFSSPRELADYLNYLDGDAEAYEAYFKWKSGNFRPGFRKMLEAITPEPLCRLGEAVAARTLARREGIVGPDAPFTRPLHFHRWRRFGLLRRARNARQGLFERVKRWRPPGQS